MTLLFILLPAASGWACTPVFVRGRASTLRLNVGSSRFRLTPDPAPRCIIKVSPGTALATAANSGSLRGLSARAVTAAAGQSAVRGVTRPTVYQTNLAGIGVRVSLRAIGGYGGFPDRPTPSPFSQRVDNPAALPDAVWKLGYFRLTIELIKTGPAATPGELEYHSERF